ncbi:trypsin delta/gamma-like protein CG30031 [Agrilus planipennis]|uniref:Trypsin delta/gamma-like protein CG30031 n=1 Tax=Agrilus planipennis TaxID=224129 RepID=A0A1W4WUP7_AGRPL|nr:trypsin delta/gamma-like protein CG30031 [Agrilus planipennis]
MKFLVVLLGLVCALAHGAPNVEKVVDSPRPAFSKDIEIIPSDNTRITNSDRAFRDQFPYQVSLEWGYLESPSHLCGGSLISESVVLTAAHCIESYGTYTIAAGLLNRGETTATSQRRSVDTIVVHENWPGEGPAPYDIALVKAVSPFTLTSSVQTVGIPSQGIVPSGTGIVSGWGRTFYNSVLPTVLQYANLRIITNNECAQNLINVLGYTSALDDTQICTSARVTGQTGRVSVCSGDSGSPLVQGYVQVGIVSWGITPCGTTYAPSVYTRVSTYSDWINDRLAELSSAAPSTV